MQQVHLSEKIQLLVRDYFKTNMKGPVDPMLIAERAWKRLTNRIGAVKQEKAVGRLLHNFSFEELLPVWNEWEQQLDCLKRYTNLPYYQLHISFSSPVIDDGLLSINSLLKMYNRDHKQCIRVKISCFMDHQRERWWEVGFVHIDKSIESDRYLKLTDRTSYYLLSELVANTFSFLPGRPGIKGIHLSPAYFHVLPLSERIVKQYQHKSCGSVDQEWRQSLEFAFNYYCEKHAVPRARTVSQNKFLVSQLLHEEKLMDPGTGRPMIWNPPPIYILR